MVLTRAYQIYEAERPSSSEAARRPPVNPAPCGSLLPTVKDRHAGLVGLAQGFEIGSYGALQVDRFAVPEGVIRGLPVATGRAVASAFEVEFVRDLERYQRARFRVITAPADGTAPRLPSGRALRLETRISTMTFTEGLAIVQVESCFRDRGTDAPMMVTASRRTHRHADPAAAVQAALHSVLGDLHHQLASHPGGGALSGHDPARAG
ncbi:MAG: hypothetical protein L0027_00895, partial [Candidatus Rokubacteria bacterium]|nr:hypothetical protein [Candidatus Rokubacteria bacterium]